MHAANEGNVRGLKAMRENVSTAESNQLEHAASSYLRSARHQPVQWHPWSEAAFDRAYAEDMERAK